MIEVEVKALSSPEESLNLIMSGALVFENYIDSQRNWYYSGGKELFTEEFFNRLKTISGNRLPLIQLREELPDIGKLSVRTRECNFSTEGNFDSVSLVVKATVNDTSSENGTARREYDINFGTQITLEKLEDYLQEAGFTVLSKWKRKRLEAQIELSGDQPFEVWAAIDQNAGYGDLIELEAMVDSELEVPAAEAYLRSLLAKFNLRELDQERLQKMFEVYNTNWQYFYDNNFTFRDKNEYKYLVE